MKTIPGPLITGHNHEVGETEAGTSTVDKNYSVYKVCLLNPGHQKYPRVNCFILTIPRYSVYRSVSKMPCNYSATMAREFHGRTPSSWVSSWPSAVVKLKYWAGVIWPTLLGILQHLAKNWLLFSFHGKHWLVYLNKRDISSDLFLSRWLSVHGLPGQKNLHTRTLSLPLIKSAV